MTLTEVTTAAGAGATGAAGGIADGGMTETEFILFIVGYLMVKRGARGFGSASTLREGADNTSRGLKNSTHILKTRPTGSRTMRRAAPHQARCSDAS